MDESSENPNEREVVEMREKITENVAGEIHAIQVQESLQNDTFLLVHRTTTADKIPNRSSGSFPVVDRRTVAVDRETGEITVTGNGLWTLQDTDILESEIRQIARTITDTTNPNNYPPMESAGKPADTRALDTPVPADVTEQKGQNIERMERDPGISPDRSWGYGSGAPPEVETVTERIEGVGMDPADHLIRLLWGTKEPFDNPRESVPVSDLAGNYGIEVNRQTTGLVAVDIDNPDEFDAELPDTLTISSPHGSDEQKHLLFHCEQKDEIADALGGAWASQVPEWGELWVGRRYLVGPGCELSEFGCTEGNHKSGESGGCPRCKEPGSGKYEITDDRPIATVDAETIKTELLESGDMTMTVTPDSDPFEKAASDDENTGETHEEKLASSARFDRCDKCGKVAPTGDMFETHNDAKRVTICKGGCEGDNDS